LPYIGKSPYHSNVSIAGGHAMLGVTLAAGTGYLIKQLVQKEETKIALDAFRLVR
jgi:D-amino-acid dehydrogenase